MAYEYEYDYNGDGFLEPWEVEGAGFGLDPALAYDGGGYELEGGYGLDGRVGYGLGVGDFRVGYGPYPDTYLDDGGLGLASYDPYGGGPDFLYNDMSFLDREVPLIDAWGSYGDGGWADEQYALGDLMYYQRQLEMDRALSEQERLARWEERLRWEELDDAERALRYRQMDALSLQRLGLAGGWYGRRFGGRSDIDLGYLRNVNLSRGLFAAPYRATFSRHRGLLGRFQPYYSRSHIHNHGGVGVPLLGGRVGYGVPRGVGYGSRPLAVGNSLKAQQLRTRLRIAETRAALTGLDTETRARAIDDARRIREQINAELLERRVIDREERREDAVLQAENQIARRREAQRDLDAERAVRRVEQIAYGAGGAGGAPIGRGRSGYGIY